MAIYVGEVIAVRAKATHPFTKDPITDLTGEVHFYEPSKDPKGSPTDRAAPDRGPFALSYDAASEGYVAFAPTTDATLGDWVPGKWSFRVKLAGGTYNNFEFGTVTVKA